MMHSYYSFGRFCSTGTKVMEGGCFSVNKSFLSHTGESVDRNEKVRRCKMQWISSACSTSAGLEVEENKMPVCFSSPFPLRSLSLPSLTISFPASFALLSLPSSPPSPFSPLKVGPLNPAWRSGERCKIPQRVWGAIVKSQTHYKTP